jgi:hypothetical protein
MVGRSEGGEGELLVLLMICVFGGEIPHLRKGGRFEFGLRRLFDIL